jgi:hypothetical protein
MGNRGTLQAEKMLSFEELNQEFDNFDLPSPIVTPICQNNVEEYIDPSHSNASKCIRINFDNLKSFEIVERQYESWGVVFNNSLAIQPSNPAFPTNSGATVLMASPKNGVLEVIFLEPVAWVSALVTSSQPLIFSAYNKAGQLLTQSTLPTPNLANSDSAMSPNTLLSVEAKDIQSVTFCAFDGQFTIDEFRFCFSS